MTTRVCAADQFHDGSLSVTSAPWGGLLVDLLVFVIPLGQFVELESVGKLFAPDILLLALFPVVLLTQGEALNRALPRTALVVGLIWLLAQISTDLIRATAFEDYARGWMMIVSTLTNFSVLYILLFQNERRIILYTLGFAIGGVLTYCLNPSIHALGDPWKFGYGSGITILFVLVASLVSARSKGPTAAIVMLLAATLNIYMGFRSLGGECFFVVAYLSTQQLARARRERGLPIGLARTSIAFGLLALSGFGVLRVYEYSAEHGMLGATALHKYEVQSSGRYGVLMGGRTEFFVGLEAALDSPIVGHGSWAKDWRYASQIGSMREDAGYETHSVADSWLIPAHSHLVGAWVNAGICGAFFWLWVFSLPLRVLKQLYAVAEPLAPLIVFLAIILIWDVLFSPYNAERRFITPYYIVVMMSFLDQSVCLRPTASPLRISEGTT